MLALFVLEILELGQVLFDGVIERNLPCSTSIITATPVMGLLIEAIKTACRRSRGSSVPDWHTLDIVVKDAIFVCNNRDRAGQFLVGDRFLECGGNLRNWRGFTSMDYRCENNGKQQPRVENMHGFDLRRESSQLAGKRQVNA